MTKVPEPDASPVTGYHKEYILPSIIQHYVTNREAPWSSG